MDEARKEALRLDFDRRTNLEFHGPAGAKWERSAQTGPHGRPADRPVPYHKGYGDDS